MNFELRITDEGLARSIRLLQTNRTSDLDIVSGINVNLSHEEELN